jgi:hypothetical protein
LGKIVNEKKENKKGKDSYLASHHYKHGKKYDVQLSFVTHDLTFSYIFLNNYSEEFFVLKENQCGFREGYSKRITSPLSFPFLKF